MNTVTEENVIRGELEVDEGDPYSLLLLDKSINNIKSRNIFGKVKGFVVQFIDYHPSYNWILCFDLKNDPSDFVNLSDEELKKILLQFC